MLRGLFVLGLLGAVGCAEKDPCADVAGTCLDVHVTGPSGLLVDELDFDASGALDGPRSSKWGDGAVALPVRVAIVPPMGATGMVTLKLDALRGGVVVANGETSHDIVAGMHAIVELPVSAIGGTDGGGGDDLTTPDGFTCTAGMPLACVNNGSTLQRCNATGDGTTLLPCDNNCTETPTPHCRVFMPHAPVTPDLLGGPGAGGAVTTLTSVIQLNTDTGLIQNFRAANTNPDATESQQGIIFFRNATTGVFSFNDLTIGMSSTVVVTGTRSLALVASNNITVQGTLDGRPTAPGGGCSAGSAGAGGFAGGSSSVNGGSGSGIGGGKANTASAGGGGGGGNGEAARAGGSGNNGAATGGAGGVVMPLTYPILGGGGGGSGSGAAFGGGGGGAIHLAAGKKISIGGVGSLVGINVSGCGGKDGIMLSSPGGGGAGGTILIEAPIVDIAGMGSLVANGGGGGGKNGSVGAVSDLNGNAAPGGSGDTSYAAGGQGGANSFAPGNQGVNGAAGVAGGGAGGAVGRILLFNLTGSLTPGAGSVISPQIGLSSQGGMPISLVAPIDLQ